MCFVAVVFSTYYAFVVLGWFGGQSPPLLIVLALTGLLALVIGFLGLVIAVTTEDMIKRQVTATTDPSVRPLNLDDRLELLGCQIPLIVIALCLTVCSALSIFSLVHGNGWVVLAFVAAVLGNFIAPRGIAFLSNRLSRRGLLAIFGIPGVLAAALGFVANFPDLLRILPW
jgi:hypothetical protein